jgi:hypothetical protein
MLTATKSPVKIRFSLAVGEVGIMIWNKNDYNMYYVDSLTIATPMQDKI